MARPSDIQREGPTVKAVLAEAKRLRAVAARARLADCYAKPYDPSDFVARHLSQVLGPTGAIAELKRRAGEADLAYKADTERSDRARGRLDRHHRNADAHRRQRLSSLTIGQRLDEALAALATVSEMSAAALGERVGGGSESEHVGPGRQADRVGVLRSRALRLVAEIEDELPRGRRRIDVPESRAA